MNLHIQTYLRSKPREVAVSDHLNHLTTELGIHIKRHLAYPNLCLFKYNQISSPMGDPIVQECRGIILDEENDWKVVAFPFKKFFNSTDSLAASIDWSSASVLEKLDGSLCSLYYYKGWQVSTSGTPDATGEVQGFPMTFQQLFWKTYITVTETELDVNKTYMFELTSPYNKIVVRHDKASMTLIGIRNNLTGEEEPISSGPVLWNKVKSFSLNSEREILDSFDTFGGVDQEGFVVVDGNYNRVKMKHPEYVTLHHMRGNGTFTLKRALSVILTGEKDEVLGYFPEYKPTVDLVLNKMNSLISEANDIYQANKHIPIQKDFAARVIHSRLSGAMFAVRGNKSPSIEAYVRAMNCDRLMELLDIKEAPNGIGD